MPNFFDQYKDRIVVTLTYFIWVIIESVIFYKYIQHTVGEQLNLVFLFVFSNFICFLIIVVIVLSQFIIIKRNQLMCLIRKWGNTIYLTLFFSIIVALKQDDEKMKLLGGLVIDRLSNPYYMILIILALVVGVITYFSKYHNDKEKTPNVTPVKMYFGMFVGNLILGVIMVMLLFFGELFFEWANPVYLARTLLFLTYCFFTFIFIMVSRQLIKGEEESRSKSLIEIFSVLLPLLISLLIEGKN